MPPIITAGVADYGTRALLTKAAAQQNLYSYSAAMSIGEVDTSTVGAYRSLVTNIGLVSNEAVTAATYTAGQASVTSDNLLINQQARFSELVAAFDDISIAKNSLIADRAMNASKSMAQSIDRFVINKAVTDTPTMLVDAGAISSATVFAATPWTVTAANALDVVNATVESINFNEGYGDSKFVLVDTSFVRRLTGAFQATAHDLADAAIRGGIPYVGTLAGGVKVFQTNNVPHYAVVTFGATVTAADFIEVLGARFTFVAAIGVLPGNVLIGANAAASQANFQAALLAPQTTNATQVALSLDNQARVRNLLLSAASVSTAVQISSPGAFRITASFASGSNTVSLVRKRLLAGSMNAIKVFVPTTGMVYKENDMISGVDGTEVYMRQFFNSMTETRKRPLTCSVLTV